MHGNLKFFWENQEQQASGYLNFKFRKDIRTRAVNGKWGKVVVQTVGAYESPFSIWMFPDVVQPKSVILFLQENRIHTVGGCFQKGNNTSTNKGQLKGN